MGKAQTAKSKTRRKPLHTPPVEMRQALAMPRDKRAAKRLGYIKSRRGNW